MLWATSNAFFFIDTFSTRKNTTFAMWWYCTVSLDIMILINSVAVFYGADTLKWHVLTVSITLDKQDQTHTAWCNQNTTSNVSNFHSRRRLDPFVINSKYASTHSSDRTQIWSHISYSCTSRTRRIHLPSCRNRHSIRTVVSFERNRHSFRRLRNEHKDLSNIHAWIKTHHIIFTFLFTILLAVLFILNNVGYNV